MATEKKLYKFDEVAKHNQLKDCWLLINGKIYDVTPFMDDHPGGDDVMVSSTGKDATNDFDDVGHSKNAREMLIKYYIGDIDPSSVPDEHSYVPPPPKPSTSSQQSSGSGSMTRILQFLVPILFLGLAIVIKNFTKTE